MKKSLPKQSLNGPAPGGRAFSYSKSQASRVIAYIQNQEVHHRKITFLDEYKKFLEKFEVDYDERYIFKEPE